MSTRMMRDLVAPGPHAESYLPEYVGAARRDAAVLLGLTVFLVLVGLLMVYSASSFLAQSRGLPDHYYLQRQAERALVGFVVLYVCARMDYRVWRKMAWPLLAASALALLVVVAPGTHAVAPVRNGARRWLELGVTLQPSELAKLAAVIWTAALATKKGERIRSLRWGLVPTLLVLGALMFLILVEPDLSGAALLGLVAALTLFVAGARIGHFILLAMLALPILWDQIADVSYRLARVVAFLDGRADPAGAGYQLQQSLIAIGSGGPLGVGFGESVQKFHFLPEPHKDFVFAIVAEEWGFVGALVMIAALALVGHLGLRIARRAPDRFGFLLGAGLTMLLVCTAAIHLAVTMGVLPTAGGTLPFVSYGGSNLVVSLAAAGILLNIGSWRA